MSDEAKRIYEALRAPFDPRHDAGELEWRPQNVRRGKMNPGDRVLALAYVTARAVAKRLTESCGVDGWKSEHREVELGSVVATWDEKLDGKPPRRIVETTKQTAWLCRLSIRIGDEWVVHEDGAPETDIEALKGGLSKSLVRVAVRVGVGAYLYQLPDVWVQLNERGKIPDKFEPPLPDWAIPDLLKGKRVGPVRAADREPEPPAKSERPPNAAPGEPQPVGQVIDEKMPELNEQVSAALKSLKAAMRLVPVSDTLMRDVFLRVVDWKELRAKGIRYINFAEAALRPPEERAKSGGFKKLQWALNRPDLQKRATDVEQGREWRDWINRDLYRNCVLVADWVAQVEKAKENDDADPMGTGWDDDPLEPSV